MPVTGGNVAPVCCHDDDAIMLLNFCQQQIDMVAAVLLPILKDGFTLIKEQQSIMNFCLPADRCNKLQPGTMRLPMSWC